MQGLIAKYNTTVIVSKCLFSVLASRKILLGEMAETTSDFQYPPTIADHLGTWEGKAVKVNQEGEIVDSHSTKIEMGAKGAKFSQRNTYTWPDGRKSVQTFAGRFENGKLLIETKLLKGECIVISDNVFVFNECGIGEGAKYSGCELLTMSCDKKTRMRAMHYLKDGKPSKTSSAFENLVSKDDVYFDAEKEK